CDVGSSYRWARLIIGEVTAAVLDFLQTVVRPAYRRAGWHLQRVLTDNGLPQKSRRQSFSDLTVRSLETDARRQAVPPCFTERRIPGGRSEHYRRGRMRLDGSWRRDPPAWSRRFREAAILGAGGDHGIRDARHLGRHRRVPFPPAIR